MIREFPQDFTWGVATAAFQIEGAATEGGRAPSIWDTFCRQPGAIAGGDTGEVACDHYHRFADDVALIRDLGFPAYRFSTSWARVCPDGRTPNTEGIAFYERLLDELQAAGIEPWLTLYHWDMPQVLQDAGGWTRRETAEAFADYSEVLYLRFGGRVRNWMTINEPWCIAMLGYASGEHAPGHTNPREAAAAVHNVLLAHGLASERMRKIAAARGWDLNLGIVLNFAEPKPAVSGDPGCQEAARRIDGATARIFLDPLFRGQYPEDVLKDMASAGLGTNVRSGDMQLISAPMDFLGVNFYGGCAVAPPESGPWGVIDDDEFSLLNAAGRPWRSPWVGSEGVQVVSRGKPRTAMGWEVEADDLRALLVRLHEEYTGPAGIPLVVCENGAAYEDVAGEDGYVDDSADRGLYYGQHLAAVHEAIGEGVVVTGYFAWSLLDNFEWAFGYAKRFGIVRVDYETQRRIPKWSANFLGEVARSNRLSGF